LTAGGPVQNGQIPRIFQQQTIYTEYPEQQMLHDTMVTTTKWAFAKITSIAT
jgi:hypothetical protein